MLPYTLLPHTYPRVEQQQHDGRRIPADAIFDGLVRLIDAMLKAHPVPSHTLVSVNQTVAEITDLEKRLHSHLPHLVMTGICQGQCTNAEIKRVSAIFFPLFYREKDGYRMLSIDVARTFIRRRLFAG